MDRMLVEKAYATLAEKRVLLVAGGNSTERGSSLTTRDALIPILRPMCLSLEVVDPVESEKLVDAVSRADFVLNVVYGNGGEDGVMQGFLETLRVPYAGPSVLASAVGMNKEIFISLLRDWGFPVPVGMLASDIEAQADKVRSLKTMSAFILKPIDEGDSLGIRLLDSWEAVRGAISQLPKHELRRWRIEEFVPGPFGTVGVFQVGSELIVGDVVQFKLPVGHRIYDSELKLRLVDERATPEFLSGPVAERIKCDAIALYQRLSCKGLVRFDYILRDDGPVYLEINTIPGLYPGSNAALSYQNICSFSDLLAVTMAAQMPSGLAPDLNSGVRRISA